MAVASLCVWCGAEARNVFEAAVNDPVRVGFGPAPTSSADLARFAPIVWDVNGYYRDLGVPTDATRLQLRQAYTAREGWRSERLTYVIKQLLDPEVRARYDAVPPGQFFFDEYVRQSVLREAAAASEGGVVEQGEARMDFKELLDQAFDPVDRPTAHPAHPAHLAQDSCPWELWRWREFETQVGLTTITRLASALLSQRVRTRFGVGTSRGDGWTVRTDLAPHPVVVLGSDVWERIESEDPWSPDAEFFAVSAEVAHAIACEVMGSC